MGDDEAVTQIGGRALREMTRIAHSPYSMWRDIALTNSQNLEAALLRFEQQLAHLRENLRGPDFASCLRAPTSSGKSNSQLPVLSCHGRESAFREFRSKIGQDPFAPERYASVQSSVRRKILWQ